MKTLNNNAGLRALLDNFSQHLSDAETLPFARINQPQYHQKPSLFCIFHKVASPLYAPRVFH